MVECFPNAFDNQDTFQISLSSFDIPFSLRISLISGTMKMFWALLVFSLHQLWNQQIHQRALLTYPEKQCLETKIGAVGMLKGPGVIFSRPSKQAWLENTCIYTNLNIHNTNYYLFIPILKDRSLYWYLKFYSNTIVFKPSP